MRLFLFVAYTRDNHLKRVAHIISVYKEVKEDDIPDSRIVRHIFPQYKIFISYRQWMNIKNMRPSEYKNQLQLF